VNGSRVTAIALKPYNRYFKTNKTNLLFPPLDKQKTDCSWKDAFSHTIPGLQSNVPLDKILSPGLEVEISGSIDQENVSPRMGYYFKEESLYYNQPEHKIISEPIICSFPYSRIAYWGVIENPQAGIELISKKRTFTVKDKIIQSLELRDPISERVSPGSKQSVLGWITVDSQKIKFSKERNPPLAALDLEVWQNGKKLRTENFRILNKGRKWVVPIVFEMREHDVNDIQFLMTVKDKHYSDFAVAYEKRRYTLFSTRTGVKIGREPPSPLINFYPIFFKPKEPIGYSLINENVSEYKIKALDQSYKKWLNRSEDKLLPPKCKNETFVFSLLS
jgi:hypothetical protein